jgi:hypothetical protein
MLPTTGKSNLFSKEPQMSRFVRNLFRSVSTPLLVGFALLSVGASLSRAETRLVKKPAPQPSLVKTAAAVSTLNKVALNPQPLPPRDDWRLPNVERLGGRRFHPLPSLGGLGSQPRAGSGMVQPLAPRAKRAMLVK